MRTSYKALKDAKASVSLNERGEQRLDLEVRVQDDLFPVRYQEVETMSLKILDARLGSTVLQMVSYAPDLGPLILSLDIDLLMYYPQENSAPFDYSKPWEVVIDPGAALETVGKFIVKQVVAQSYHARFLAVVHAFAKSTVQKYAIKFTFRCGTSTPKGQWLFSTFRCESALGWLTTGPPTVSRVDDVLDLNNFWSFAEDVVDLPQDEWEVLPV